MRHGTGRRLPALLLAAALLAAPALRADSLEQREAELRELQSRVAEIQRALEHDRGARHREARALSEAEREVERAATELRGIRTRLARQRDRVEAIQAQKAAEEQRLAAQRQALGQQVRMAYLLGEQAQTRLLLSQDDPAELSRIMTWFDYLNRARASRIRSIDEQLQSLVRLAERLSDELARLAQLQARQQESLARLEDKRGERARALAALERRIRSQGRELTQLQADERALTKLIESLRDVLSDIPAELPGDQPFAQLRGALPWPVQGRLLARYGEPKAGGKLKWNGIWIAAGAGTPVHAVARGRVAYVGWMHRYGLITVLEHGGGYFSLYGHSQSAEKTAGEWVQAGETIALAGDSGGQDQSGVYLEIRKGSEPVDPRPWLAH